MSRSFRFIYAVIVVYNKNVYNSITCNFFIKISDCEHLKLVIVDNSTTDTENEVFCTENNIIYYSMGGNQGLSKAYNKVLNNLNYTADDVILFLDDDTELGDGYLDVLIKSLNEHPEYDIYCPCVLGQDNKYYSPNEYSILRCRQMKDSNDLVRNNKFNAINSCSAIRAYIFDSFRYDERMFLDQIDHYFFRYQREQNRKFYKMPIIIHQNFFLDKSNTDFQKVWNRYYIMIRDFYILTSNRGFIVKLVGFLKVLLWGVRGAYRFRKLEFLFNCFRRYFECEREFRLKGVV